MTENAELTISKGIFKSKIGRLLYLNQKAHTSMRLLKGERDIMATFLDDEIIVVLASLQQIEKKLLELKEALKD